MWSWNAKRVNQGAKLLERSRAKFPVALQLSIRSTWLIGTKTPKKLEPESFVSTVRRQRIEGIHKDTRRIQIEKLF